MITAVDTNVLIDILVPDPIFGPLSKENLRTASAEGALIISEAVYAEIASRFPKKSDLDIFLQESGIQRSLSTTETLFKAGHLWETSLKRPHHDSSGRRLLADFLIGAHALLQAERLLTRDKGFYRVAFSGLRLA